MSNAIQTTAMLDIYWKTLPAALLHFLRLLRLPVSLCLKPTLLNHVCRLRRSEGSGSSITMRICGRNWNLNLWDSSFS